MQLEKLLLDDGRTVKDKFSELTSEQQIELLNEINQKRDSLKESKIVAETNIKNLEEHKAKLLAELKDTYGINSVEEAESKIAELNGEIISVLNDFAQEYSKLQ